MDFLRNHQSLFLRGALGLGATPAPPDVCREKAFVEKGMKGLGLETSGPGWNEPGEKRAFLIGTQPKNPQEHSYCSRFSMD
jgi:hypothetical protein